MSPLFKRLSISSTKSTKSSNCSHVTSVSLNSHTSSVDTTYALNFQSSTVSPWALRTSTDDGYAQMLDDDNMSWGTGKRTRSKRRNFRLF